MVVFELFKGVVVFELVILFELFESMVESMVESTVESMAAIFGLILHSPCPVKVKIMSCTSIFWKSDWLCKKV